MGLIKIDLKTLSIEKNAMKQCKWCNYNDNQLLIKEYKHWKLFLSESQFIIGWCYAVLKRHVIYYDELTNEEIIELKRIIKETRKLLDKKFHPDWYNVMQLGNMDKHLHIQIFPRYKTARKVAGKTFKDPDYGNMLQNRYKPEKNAVLKKIVSYIQKK